MSTDKLLTKRVKIINDFPGRVQEIGTIIECNKYGFNLPMSFKGEPFMFVCCLDCMPVLFKHLEWWEDLKMENMPIYVKQKITGQIAKADWQKHSDIYFANGIERPFNSTLYLLPATLQEYLDYQSTLVK